MPSSPTQPRFLNWTRGQHYLIAGQTGTGKTVLARTILRSRRYLVILDPKRTYKPGRAHVVVSDPRKLEGASRRSDCIVYRPDPRYDNRDDWNRVWEWIYRRRNTSVYVDEMGALGDNHADYPHHMKVCYQQGRELGISILGATQVPINLPGYVFTESKQFAKFHLANRDHQEKLAVWMGDTILEPDGYPRERAHHDDHSFFYWDKDMREPAVECLLRLT